MNTSKFDTAIEAALLTTPELAKLLNCSPRHIANLRSSQRIPPPVKLGELVRWPRRVIDDWIDQGCPAASTSA
jgi:excisionase family DNA binding protein